MFRRDVLKGGFLSLFLGTVKVQDREVKAADVVVPPVIPKPQPVAEWYQCGKFHRENGPAIMIVESDFPSVPNQALIKASENRKRLIQDDGPIITKN